MRPSIVREPCAWCPQPSAPGLTDEDGDPVCLACARAGDAKATPRTPPRATTELAPVVRLAPRRRPTTHAPRARKGVDYLVVSVTLYPADLARLDRLAEDLRHTGHPHASRSAVVRAAVAQFDASRVEEAS